MPAPYGLDLRKRIIDTIEEGKQSLPEIAKRFLVSYDFVYHLWKRYQQTGNLEAKKVGGRTPPKVDQAGEAKLKEWLEKQPDMTLLALCDKYRQEVGITLSKSSMDRALKRAGISFKKKVPTIQENTAKKIAKEDKPIMKK